MSHEKGIEAATKVMSTIDPPYAFRPSVKDIIKAYLDASGMVMVPREPTEDMINAAVESPVPVSYAEAGWCYNEMMNHAPNPF